MKPQRNAPCPCGSGKKYKKCCLLKEPDGLDAAGTEPMRDEREARFEERAFWARALTNMRRYALDQKPHIKAYYKLRKLHAEIVGAMAQYHQDGKFEQMVDTGYAPPPDGRAQPPESDLIELLHCDFDLETRVGTHAFYDMLVYKSAPNTNCITEDFIQKHRYRKEEKVAFLHSMLESKLGLFEVTGTDPDEGYAFLNEVFTGEEYTIIDVALSGADSKDCPYIYTRIIEHQGICFGTGLNIAFAKSDNFIKAYIREHRRNYSHQGELIRFTQLYNQFAQSQDSINVVPNSF
ncbi:MAG: SEC-C domain-containing protein [Clostridiales Family XIII bacterium]|jgi:hypothetical protein|nr:SEC-C domain-containing protein [Clostridiales Family XIII bacterium]